MGFLDKSHPRLSWVRQCGLLSISRSSTYYTPKNPDQKSAELINEIRDIWEKHPFYGYRRIKVQLKRQGLCVNHKRVQRLMKSAGIEALYPKPHTSKKGMEHRKYPYLLKGLNLKSADQVWATDITYIKLPQGFVYLIALIDVYSRYILSWRLSNSLSLPFCLEALEEALRFGIPVIFNTDQGAQFTSDEWIYTLVNWGIQPSMTGVGRCLDNVHCERFWRTLKYEDVYLYGYENVAEARDRIEKFIEFYNHQRPHQSLGYKVPFEVYQKSHGGTRHDGYEDNSFESKIELPSYPQACQKHLKEGSLISLI